MTTNAEKNALFARALASQDGILVSTNDVYKCQMGLAGYQAQRLAEHPEWSALSIRIAPDRKHLFIIKDHNAQDQAKGTAGEGDADPLQK